jgi:predicted XRE-type DNA-binding protein
MSENDLNRLRTELFDRAKAILKEQDDYREKISTLSATRRELIDELRSTGLKAADIAKGLGITRARMSQLSTSGPPPERAFLGSGKLAIVVGQKPKPNNTKSLIAVETMNARDRLRELATAYQLESGYEIVPPPGLFDLNRSNLVALAGPRLMPMVGQILAGDPNIRFEAGETGGWTLRDIHTGETFSASPRDAHSNPVDLDHPNRDFGYLGRLPRPDGNGTFLCFAGIHATGTQGVVAYLEQNLAQLYSEVKTRRFSTLIECEYDPETRVVATTKLASPIYKRS